MAQQEETLLVTADSAAVAAREAAPTAVATPEVPTELEPAAMDVQLAEPETEEAEAAAEEAEEKEAAEAQDQSEAALAPQAAAAAEVEEQKPAMQDDMPLDALLLLAGLAGGDLRGLKDGPQGGRANRWVHSRFENWWA